MCVKCRHLPPQRGCLGRKARDSAPFERADCAWAMGLETSGRARRAIEEGQGCGAYALIVSPVASEKSAAARMLGSGWPARSRLARPRRSSLIPLVVGAGCRCGSPSHTPSFAGIGWVSRRNAREVPMCVSVATSRGSRREVPMWLSQPHALSVSASCDPLVPSRLSPPLAQG